MALRAFSLARTRLKLSLVWVNRVAIHALCKSQLLFEISAYVAIDAANF